ncbi:MAG: cadherin domain-containing protein [Cyclobacteriaceae bacterium]
MTAVIIWLLGTPIVAQDVQVNFASNRDSVGTEGDIVRVPILLDTVYTNDMLGENIIALNLTFSHSPDLIPQGFDFNGGLIQSWSHNTSIKSNNQFSITAAGVNPIALDSGLLFYVDFLLGDVTSTRSPTFTLVTSGMNNYFNEGGYVFTMDYGQIKINPILQLSASSSPSRITVGDSTRISASGGTAPYTYSVADPTFGSIVSDQYFLADRHGFAVVNVEDSNGLTGSTTVEVRSFELGFIAQEDLVYPGEDALVYLTTTDLLDLDIISGSFEFTRPNNDNIDFKNFVLEGFLLEDYSIEMSNINDYTYKVAFAGAAAIGAGDTLLGITFSTNSSPSSTTTTLQITDNKILFNDDLPGNRGLGASIRFINLIAPNLNHPAGNYIPGDQIQFAGSGGTLPYTWSVSDNALATIDSIGLLTVKSGGLLTVTITDSLGVSANQVINLYDGKVDIADHSASPGSQYLLPIELTELPDGRGFSAFSFDFAYDTSKVEFVEVVKAGSLTENFTIVENELTGVKHRVVGGGTNEVTGPGDFIYLSFLLDNLDDGSTTSITMNSIQLNEGSPLVFSANGSLKATFSPNTRDTTLVIDEDEAYSFISADFPFDHPDDTKTFQGVRFTSLPMAGTLVYFSTPISLNQQIPVSNLANLVYQPESNESGQNYVSFDFVVVDNANTPSNYSATVTMDVTPVNDTPSFTQSQNSIDVDEDFVDPIVVQFTPNAVPDDELNQTVTYSISPDSIGIANMVFDENNLTLTFSSIENAFGSEIITITADDGQSELNTFSQVLSISVSSVNDLPVIADQTFSLEENSGLGTIAGTVLVQDEDDSSLVFTISSGNIDNAFSLNNSGVLSVNNFDAIDFETNPVFTLLVNVSDGSANVSATITVNLTDVDEDVNQAPQINPQTFSLDENSPVGTLVGTIESFDPDGDALTYTITAGNTNNTFAIDGTTGALTVADVSQLDFETTPTFTLTVQVSDAALNASATITINLNDVDETVNQAPQIIAQTFNIDENSANGTAVGTVVASDPEGDALTYTITAGNTNNAFAIDGATGALTVADVSQLDFETTPTFSLTVQVADASLNASAIITINLNDLNDTNVAPQIVDQTFSVNENSANGTAVGTVVASDSNGDVLTYGITAGNTNNAFAIDGATGALTVADVAQLDFETTPTFTLTVQVSDAALNASATITINLNDVDETVNLAPVVSDQVFFVDENSEVGTVVGTVSATDPENDILSFSITTRNDDGAFSISSSSGRIVVSEASNLDFELNESFSLKVAVTDGDLVSEALITINLNDLDETVLKDESQSALRIYPNPTVGLIQIDGVKVEKVKLYNAAGIELLETTKSQLDLTELPSGIYFVEMISVEGIVEVTRIRKN